VDTWRPTIVEVGPVDGWDDDFIGGDTRVDLDGPANKESVDA